MNSTDQLIVEAATPPAPLILASSGFLNTLASVEEDVAALKITDQTSYKLAATLQVRLTSAGSALEKQRVALKSPFIEIGRKIDEAAKFPANRIEAAKNSVKRAIAAYDAEQQRLAAEAERKRQEELAKLEAARAEELRLEEERRQQLEAEAKAAAAKAPVATAAPLDFDEPEPAPEPPKTETQVALETLQHTPVVAPVRPAGISFKITLVPVVVDLKQVPDVFVERTVKLRAVISTFCQGWREGDELPVCPGVRFDVKKEPVSTGRSTF
jgi:hypothetical protein